MSYQVLARKWRPHNFQQVVGQQHVLTALVNALEQNRLHHAYLLSGTRGIGKTTIARILAKSLNCEKGITSKPCGECSTCIEIDQGSYVDLLEIDAASRTKVEDTRELLDNVQYKPARGRFKVYLIDEVHMLSKHSFNALLKTLEEPPEYVKFVLATTDPQKLPITVLSRCLQFHLKSLTSEQISQQLVHVLSQEHCQYELSALHAIAKAADGSMRDALSLTDQALSHGGGQILHQAVLDMLGTLDHGHIVQLLQLIVAGDANACMAKIAEISLLGPDYDQLHVELASLLHRIAMAQILPSSALDTEQAEQIKVLCEQMSPEDVQLYYQIALTGRKELPLAPDPRSALEMTILRILAFRPQGRLPQPELDVTSAPIVSGMEQNVVADAASGSAADINVPVTDTTVPANTVMPVDKAIDSTIASTGQPTADELNHLNVEQNEIMQAAADMGYALPTADAESTAPQSASYTPEPVAQAPVTEAPIAEPLAENITPDAPAPVSGSATVEQGRTTRNFLRSRLGSAAKKSTAAKSEQAPSSQYVPPKKAVNPVDSNVTNRFNESVAGYATSGTQPSSSEQYSTDNQAAPTWQELPPLEAYQDQGQVVAEQSPQIRQTERFSQVEVDINDLSPAFQPQKATQSTNLPVIDNKLRDETDPWCCYINQMELGGRVRQMALHSVMEQQPGRILLTMNPDQRYFANEKSKLQLKTALEQVLSESVELEIRFGEDSERSTPAQIEERIYQQRLANATKNLYDDKYIQFFINRLGAVVDDSSIVPV